jgi:hypothetical protein
MKITEKELQEMLEDAHMAGQHDANPDIGNASYHSAMVYAKEITNKTSGE